MDSNKLRLNKIFVGGLPLETTEDQLKSHFSKYGQIIDFIIIKDKQSKKSRGFGFVTFKELVAMQNAIKEKQKLREKSLDVKVAEPKKANKFEEAADVSQIFKLFIGGIPKEVTPQIFREHFQQYGQIADIVLIEDKKTSEPRGFGFVTYQESSSVQTAMADYTNHCLMGKWVECKLAMPKNAFEEASEPPRGKPRDKVKNSTMGKNGRLSESYTPRSFTSSQVSYPQKVAPQSQLEGIYMYPSPPGYARSSLSMEEYAQYQPYACSQSQPYFGDPLNSPEQLTRGVRMSPANSTLGVYAMSQQPGMGYQVQPSFEYSVGSQEAYSEYPRMGSHMFQVYPPSRTIRLVPDAPRTNPVSPHSHNYTVPKRKAFEAASSKQSQNSHGLSNLHCLGAEASDFLGEIADASSPYSSSQAKRNSPFKRNEGFNLYSEVQHSKSKTGSTHTEREVIISKKRTPNHKIVPKANRLLAQEKEISEEGSCLASDDEKLKSLSNNDSQKDSTRDIKAQAPKELPEREDLPSQLDQVSLSSLVLIGFKAPAPTPVAAKVTLPVSDANLDSST